ncbi:MAG: hypothetical protein COT85_01450 [Chlamydiae bacterium CG10_big_fil_rev_8_21_14_0_10_42_34]|nr:MAG: hypothetical protein COT85_01450 [Chlamydiae bacterium CG10_big_fil_rev_8_21_14_0_10_42_34]
MFDLKYIISFDIIIYSFRKKELIMATISNVVRVDSGRGHIPEDDEKEQEPVSPANWLAPLEQVDQLALPLKRREIAYTKLNSFPDTLKMSAIDRIAQSTLECSGIFCEGSKTEILSLQDLTIMRLLNLSPLPPCLMNWYKALYRLNALPKKIPPLPNHIHHILESKCPIYGDPKKEDGTNVKVKDTHVLYLIPKEFKSLNYFEREILKPYGQTNCKDQNPLQFYIFDDNDRREHGDKPFADTHWVLMSKDVLPDSKNKSWATLTGLVESLARKNCVDYEIPTLQEAFAVMMLHKVATGERLYDAGNELIRWNPTYISVALDLVIGSFKPSGVNIQYRYDDMDVLFTNYCGAAALRRF